MADVALLGAPNKAIPSRQRGVAGRFARSWVARLGAIILALAALVAVVGPSLSPYDPTDGNLSARLLPPSTRFPLGTDGLGRDILSRLLSGARIAFQVGLISVTIACLVGVTLGLTAGFYGGRVDAVLMSSVDILLAFPYLLLALVIVTGLGPGLTNAMIAVGIVYVPIFARVVRAMVLSVRARDYVLAARAIGASNRRIMIRHILTNSLSPIVVQVSLSFGSAIVSAATLSFLGLGAQPPTPEWGAMLSDGRAYLRVAPWVATFPGLAILLVAVGCNLLGDGLRDALDPRLKS